MNNPQICISPDQRWPSTGRIMTNVACSPQLIDNELGEPCISCRIIAEGIVDRNGHTIGGDEYQNKLVCQENNI